MDKKVNSNEYVELYFNEVRSMYKWFFFAYNSKSRYRWPKGSFHLMMSTMKNYKPKIVLADDRLNLATFTVDVQEWIAQITINSLISCNAEKFAVVRPKEMFNDLATEQAVEEAEKIAGDIKIHMFSEVEEAEEWLKQ